MGQYNVVIPYIFLLDTLTFQVGPGLTFVGPDTFHIRRSLIATVLGWFVCKMVNEQKHRHSSWSVVMWFGEILCGGSGCYFPGSDSSAWVGS